MQLTRFTDYGLRALMYLAAEPGKRSSVKEISEYHNISRNHLVKVIHRLAKIGYIETIKGKGGGIKINNSTPKLRLGDIILKLEPNMFIVECFDANTNTCRITNACHLKHALSLAAQNFIDTMNQYTLSDMVDNKTTDNDVSLVKI